MARKSNRIKFSLKGQTSQADKFFLDALALAHFGEKYEKNEIKKKTLKLVRTLMKDEPVISVNVIHQNILASFLPQSIQDRLKE